MTKPKLRAVGCFIEYDGKILLLLRHPSRPHGNTWALPTGKVEVDESDSEAVIREVFEETGYQASEAELEFVTDYLYDFPDLTLEYPTYRIKLNEQIEI